MAASRLPISKHKSEQFVENAGAVVFRLSTQEICLLRSYRDEYFLPKERRNVGESRTGANLREVKEETGYYCCLLLVTIKSRATPTIEIEPSAEISRLYYDITEPFTMKTRHLQTPSDVKLVWWYIAAIDEDKPYGRGEDKFDVKFCGYKAATEKLTFQLNRDMVQHAIQII